MTLLFLGSFDNFDTLIINSTSTFCAYSPDVNGGDTTLWEIDPVARTLISTTTIAGMTNVISISPDGAYVFGQSDETNGNALVWHGGGTTNLPQPGSGTYPQVCLMNGAAADGTPVGEVDGHWDPTDATASAAIVWPTPFTGDDVAPNVGYNSRGLFASANGAAVVGTHLNLQSDFFVTIFRWLPASGFTVLASPVGSPNVAVRGISADATTVIGVAWTTGPGNTNEAIYWDAADALHVIGLPPGATFSDTFGVSSDGVTIGVNSDAGVYRWTVAGGFVYTGINDTVNPTLSADGGEILTTAWWIDDTNTYTSTGLAGGRMIAADGRAAIGSLNAVGTPGSSDVYVFFPGSPPPPAVLSLGNVIVTSLATESPCTAALFDPAPTITPSLGLRWSNTRGATWGNPVPQPLTSDLRSQPRWNRTGYARDRVFELFWSSAYKTALNGAFVDVVPWKS